MRLLTNTRRRGRHVLGVALLAIPLAGSAASLSPAINLSIQRDIKLQPIFRPMITGYTLTGCVRPGAEVTILGSNLGTSTGRSVALGGNGTHANVTVVSWSANRILVRLPSDLHLTRQQGYFLAIENSSHNTWLSNTDKLLSVCSTAAPARGFAPAMANLRPAPTMTLKQTPPPVLQAAPPISVERPAPPAPAPPAPAPANSTPPEPTPPAQAGAEESSGSGSTTGAAYPTDSGANLMDSPLPAPPTVPAMTPKEIANAEPGEVVVTNDSRAAAQRFARWAQGAGLSIMRRTTLGNLGLVETVLRVPQGSSVGATLKLIRAQQPKLWVDANHRYVLQGADAGARRYGPRLIGWHGAAARCVARIRVGLLDTGVDRTHPALRGQAITEKSFLAAGIARAPLRHGTAIAALLAGAHSTGRWPALLPGAHLYVGEIFRQRTAKQVDTTAEWIAQGLNWLVGEHVRTINLSLGGPRDLLVEAAVRRVLARGIAVVAAAGNGGPDGPAVYPAAQSGVVAVTAVDARRRLYRFATHGDYIEFSAPGVDVWSAAPGGGGAFYTGTSYAAPFVTAALATRAATAPLQQAVHRLARRAMDLGPPGRDNEYGWGLVQDDGRCAR